MLSTDFDAVVTELKTQLDALASTRPDAKAQFAFAMRAAFDPARVAQAKTNLQLRGQIALEAGAKP